MVTKKKDSDITDNQKVVEWLKAELVDSTAVLFKSLLKASNEITADALATIIITCYLLGKRVGIPFQTIDMVLKHKINTTINDTQEIEQWYDDLKEMQNYMINKEKKR